MFNFKEGANVSVPSFLFKKKEKGCCQMSGWETVRTFKCRCGGTVVEKRKEVGTLKAPIWYDKEWRYETGYDYNYECEDCGYSDYEPACLTD